jgi:hypothetical protein
MPTLTLDNKAAFYFEYRVSPSRFLPLLLALMGALGIDIRAVAAPRCVEVAGPWHAVALLFDLRRVRPDVNRQSGN